MTSVPVVEKVDIFCPVGVSNTILQIVQFFKKRAKAGYNLKLHNARHAVVQVVVRLHDPHVAFKARGIEEDAAVSVEHKHDRAVFTFTGPWVIENVRLCLATADAYAETGDSTGPSMIDFIETLTSYIGSLDTGPAEH